MVVVQNPNVLEKLSNTFRPIYLKSGFKNFEMAAKSENFSPFYNAPTYIMVFGNKNAIAPIHDGSLALENMLLAAESLGLGGCWLHSINYVFTTLEGRGLTQELGIPDDHIPVGAIALGYKDTISPKAAPRRKDNITIIK